MLIGIDVGGTFTDAVVLDADGGGVLLAFKLPSTRSNPGDAVITALQRIADDVGVRGALVCHGTTVGTNTLIQRKGAKVGLLATAGFADVIELRRQNRPMLYDLPRKCPSRWCRATSVSASRSGWAPKGK